MWIRSLICRISLAAMLLAVWLAPAAASATPFLRDRRVLVLHPVVVEIGTFGIAGALVRIESSRTPAEPLNGISIEPARRGAILLSYRSTF